MTGVQTCALPIYYTFNGAKGQPVPLPTMVAAGLAWQRPALRGLTARLAVEAHATRGRAGLYAFGGELEAPIGASLRAGFRVGDDIADWSVGAGWRAGVLQVDYAFVPSKLALDDTHRFSLGAHF